MLYGTEVRVTYYVVPHKCNCEYCEEHEMETDEPYTLLLCNQFSGDKTVSYIENESYNQLKKLMDNVDFSKKITMTIVRTMSSPYSS